MTMVGGKKARCAVCGTESEYDAIISTNTMGSPDLDTRPPEMKRSTIFAWVQRCPGCGYCASDVSKAPSLADSIIHDPEYIRQLTDETCPGLANSFLCQAFIEEISGDYASAAWELIFAAWACDDAENTESARKCRSKAVDMITKAIVKGQKFAEPHGAETAIQTDLLRRAGRFTEARKLIAERRNGITDETISEILAYQDRLLAKGDETCHTIEEAIDDCEETDWCLEGEEQVDNNDDQSDSCLIDDEAHDFQQDLEDSAYWARQFTVKEYGPFESDPDLEYERDIDKAQDYNEASYWARTFPVQEDDISESVVDLMEGFCIGLVQDYEQSPNWYLEAAERGDTNAQFYIGLMFKQGYIVDSDYQQAAKWYRRAAERGDARAQYHLGDIYALGLLKEPSYEKAVKWYRKAANQNYVPAIAKLVYLYRFGYGVEQDQEQAKKWYKIAEEQGNGEAISNFVNDYNEFLFFEEVLDVHPPCWCRTAAEYGIAHAQYHFGLMLERGEAEVFNWDFEAARWGDTFAQCKDGSIYESGLDMEQNYLEAAKWYLKAANQDYEEAQYKVGLLYLQGKGVPQDFILAYMWFDIAAVKAKGELLSDVLKQRESVMKQMTRIQIGEAQKLSRDWKPK